MSKIIHKKLSRQDFNKEVLEIDKIKGLGIKNINSCVYYEYKDIYGNIVKIYCKDEHESKLQGTPS